MKRRFMMTTSQVTTAETEGQGQQTRSTDYLEGQQDILERVQALAKTLCSDNEEFLRELSYLSYGIYCIAEEYDPTEEIRAIADPVMLSYGFEFNEVYEPEGDDDTLWEFEYEEDKPTANDSYDLYIHYDQGTVKIAAIERTWEGPDHYQPEIETTMKDLASELGRYILNHCK